MHTEMPDREQAEALLAVQRQRHRINLDQLQVFKGRHLMGQECYRQLIERIARIESGAEAGPDVESEMDGLRSACAIVGEALQEAHGMMLQQAGSVRENEAMSILMIQRLDQKDAEQPAVAQPEQSTEPAPVDEGRAYTDTPGHVGVMCSDEAASAKEKGEGEGQGEDDGLAYKRDQPRVVPKHYDKVDTTDLSDMIGKTVGQAMQESRPGRPDWKPPSWMLGAEVGRRRGVP